MKKGEKASKESCEKMRIAHLGVPLSKSHADKIGKANTVPLKDRFWPKVNTAGVDECWNWLAAKDPRGYGRVGIDKSDDKAKRGRKTELAHRMAYKLTFGDVPDNMFVCHRCDNPSCCNPSHLFIGTCKDNNQDMYRKGRDANQHTGRTHCQRGHEFTEQNTYIDVRNHRSCKACSAMHHKNYRMALNNG